MGTNIEYSKVSGPDTSELVTISSLDQLKKELNITSLDTSNEEYFREKQINLKISRTDLDSLRDTMTGTTPEKLEKLKKIIDNKELVIAKTGKDADKLKSEVEILPTTPDGMKKSFEYIKTNGIKDAHRFLMISAILDKFIYANKLSIKDEGIIGSTFVVIDKEGKVQKEYSEILDNNLTKEDFEQTKIFQISMREGGIQKKADGIASKYGISLKFSNEIEKAQLKTQIDTSDMKDEEKTLLIKYLDGGYKKTDEMARRFTSDNLNNMKSAKGEYQKVTGIEWTEAKMADYARNPDKLVGEVFSSMAKNPLILLSTIGLVLGKIFGFNVFDTKDGKGSFLMKLFATGAGVGLYKATGVGNLVGDGIEGKYNESIKAGAEKVSEMTGIALAWAGNIIKQLPGKIKGTASEVEQRISFWYDFSKFEYTDIKGSKNDLIKSNFQELYSKTKSGFGTSLTKTDRKTPDKKELTNLNSKLSELYKNGIARDGSETAFFAKIGNMSVAEVIDNLTDTKPITPNTPAIATGVSPSVAPVAAVTGGVAASIAAGNSSNTGPQAISFTPDEIETEKNGTKELLSKKTEEILAVLKTKSKFGFSSFTDHEKRFINRIQSRTDETSQRIDETTINDIGNVKKDIVLWTNDLIQQINIYATKDTKGQVAVLNDRDRISKDEFERLIQFTLEVPMYGYTKWKDKSFVNHEGDLQKLNSFEFNSQISSLINDFWFVNEGDKMILNNKIKKLIPKETKENKQDLVFYKKYLTQELNFCLSDAKNTKLVSRRIDEKDITKFAFKSFDEWKNEFNV